MITYPYFSNTAATTAAVTNRLVVSTNMKVGAYTVANSGVAVWSGGFNVTVTTTAGDTADTQGTVTFVGLDLTGNAVSETLTPVAGSTITGTKVFKSVTTITGAGWVIDGAEATNDTIVCGVAAGNIVAAGNGVFGTAMSNNSVAAAIVISDKRGTIATLPASTIGFYQYHVQFAGYLKVATTSTNDVTVTHTGTIAGQ